MYITDIIRVFEPREKIYFWVLLILLISVASIDLLGLGSILPFLAVIGNPGLVHKNRFLSRIYDYSNCSNEQNFIAILGVAAFLFIIFASVLKFGAQYALYRFTNMVRHSVSMRLFHNYLFQTYSFFIHHNSREMIKTLHADTQLVLNASISSLVNLVVSLYTVVLISIVMIIAKPLATICSFLVLGGVYFLILFFSRKLIENLANARRIDNIQMFKTASEAFESFKETKISNKENYWLNLFSISSIRFAKNFSLMQAVTMAPKFLMEAACFGGIIAIATYYVNGNPQASKNLMPILAFYAFAGYRLLPSIQALFYSLATIKYNSKVLNDTLKDLSLEVSDLYKTGVEIVPKLKLLKCVEFVDVCFAHVGASEPILKKINIKIQANSFLGIVGGTGAGKSTFIDILMGLFDVDDGSIMVDGVPLTKENILSWRNNIGYVPQSISLLDTTVKNNIAFGLPDNQIDKDKVIKAAKLAQIHEFIVGLDDGYDALVGEKGARISGGQKQRIGIARALYNDPDVLIFDEATSALDEVTEQALISSIETLKGTKTIIMISHRPTTLKNCDQILRL